ncbi:6-pyruvoyl trahydropterin synthase family protein [Terrimonas alba]|uniref:6-pyruvoyl trahydropterin synthase family protein n=1 Tax=Terrimonas alba TaxID=3349636 RepID=UPI0035F45A43
MLQITKIFRFEMAHAIHGYPGKCKNIHGHSYELYVTIASADTSENFLPGPGLIMDFKELKQIVNESLIQQLDHQLVLSRDFLKAHPVPYPDNLLQWEHEPSAENILVYAQQIISKKLPATVRLVKLKLFETNDSYAEWLIDHQ